MKNLKVLIVEDEVLIAKDIKDTLKEFGLTETIMAHSKSDALKKLDIFKPDIALLDIRLGNETDGIELGAFINSNNRIPFIYITAHSDVAMIEKIVKTRPASYINKPVKKSDLFASLSLIASSIEENEKKNLYIKDGYKTLIIPFESVLYIEGEGNYIKIFTSGKKTLCRQSLESVIEQLDKNTFFRIHRSYVVNTKKITSYSKNEVKLGSTVLPISRTAAVGFNLFMINLEN